MKGSGKTSSACASGPGATAPRRKAAAYAQELWRFCRNRRVGFPASIGPLIQRVRDRSAQTGALLAVHDRSALALAAHHGKTDRRRVAPATDIVTGADGLPIKAEVSLSPTGRETVANQSVRLATDKATLGTQPDPVDDVARADPIRSRMDFAAAPNPGADVVRVRDREANALGHWRGGPGAGHRAVVRTDDRSVGHDGRERTWLDMAAEMTARGGPKGAGDASPHGREARRFVGQTGVIVHRPAKRRGSGKRHEVRGAPLGLRAAVADLRDVKGGVRARWRLRTDAARKQGDAAPVASW